MTSSRHISAMTTDRRKFTTKTRCHPNGALPYWPAVQCRPPDRPRARLPARPLASNVTDDDRRQMTDDGPMKFRYCALVSQSVVSCQLPLLMAEEIAFENGGISKFEGLVTLTLTLDRVILHTIVHHSSTSTCVPNFIEIEELFVDGRTYGRTDAWADI